jgi:hypothetical protein
MDAYGVSAVPLPAAAGHWSVRTHCCVRASLCLTSDDDVRCIVTERHRRSKLAVQSRHAHHWTQ